MLLITLMMVLFYSSAPVSHDIVTVSQHEEYQDPETADCVDKKPNEWPNCNNYNTWFFCNVINRENWHVRVNQSGTMHKAQPGFADPP